MILTLLEDVHPGENLLTPVVPAFRSTHADKALPAPFRPETRAGEGKALSAPETDADGGDEVFLFPATPAQRRFWLLDQLVPGGNSALNVPLVIRLRGRLDRPVLELALREIVARHETLRTTFHFEKGRLCQLIAPELALALPMVDTRDFPEVSRAEVPTHLLAEEARQPFDLARGPVFRTRLVRTAPEDHLLLFTVHYIVCDGWSNGVFQRELAALYTAFAQNKPSPLPDLSIQFADYAQWQHELAAAGHDAPLAYWRGTLAAPLPVLDLPVDHPRRLFRGRAAAGAVRSRPLPDPLAAMLKALAVREGVSPFMLFLAVFNVLLVRYSGGQEDVLVSTPSANRDRKELEDLIGLFVNPLLLRTDLSGNPTFGELLARVRGVVLGAFEHSEVPFEKIIEELPPRRLQANFLYQRPFVQPVRLPDLELIPLPQTASGSLFEWSAAATEDGDHIRLSLEYNADLFESDTIDRVLASFETLLAAVAAPGGTQTPISRLPLLGAPTPASVAQPFPPAVLLADRWRLTPETGRWVEQCFELLPAPAPGALPGIGCALPGIGLRVLDAHGEPVPAGVAGEICVDGLPGLERAASGQFFRTGDLGRARADGAVEWLGRLDRQSRVGGLRVDAREIETALRAHPHVREVLVWPSEGGGRVTAYVESDGAPLALVSPVQLRAFLKEQLPEESIPATFVAVDSFPRTADGWLDPARLPASRPAGREPEEPYDAPYLTIHHQLIEIWQELLDVRPIGIRDDFFDLGGNSLLAMRMLYRVEQLCGKALLPATLFQEATIEHLANEVLRRDDSRPAPEILAIQEGGTKTPIFFLHGDLTGGGFYCMRLSRRLGEDQPFYALPPLDVSEYAELPEIEHIAAAQLRTIRAVQPHGPYVLGGFCLGGLTAFEIARQLEAEGETIERLLIIDATVRNRRLKTLRRWAERVGRWRGFNQQRQIGLFGRWHFILARLERWFLMNSPDKWAVVRRRVKNRWQRLVWRFWPPAEQGNGSASASDWFDPRWDVPMVFLWATGGYSPAPYQGRATLLLSSDLTNGKGEEDAPREWGKRVSPLDTHELAGSHLACITEHVDGLAEAVRHCLEVGSRQPKDESAKTRG